MNSDDTVPGAERTLLVRQVAAPVDGIAGWVHALVVEGEDGATRRHLLGPSPTLVGRVAPASLVLEGAAVSRRHCLLEIAGEAVHLHDLGSTNGVYLDGARIAGPAVLHDGARIDIGPHRLRYERRRPQDAAAAETLAADLARARSYVNALLPAPLPAGPVRAAWRFQPCATLGGDAFGYQTEGADWFVAYALDVSGHGAGAAMHSVSVMNVLRQRALPGVDLRDPAAVLSGLNAMFDMERHDQLFFTMWYGALHLPSRRLLHAAAGHHPAALQAPDGRVALLGGRGPAIGMMPGRRFAAETAFVAPASRLHLFSDGAFELPQGIAWTMQDTIGTLCAAAAEAPEALYRRVRAVAGAAPLDDDFTALTLDIP